MAGSWCGPTGSYRGSGGDLARDFAMTEGGLRLGFEANLATGTYDVTLTMGDALYPKSAMRVFVEGALVDTVSTSAGQFAVRTYRSAVSDGRLTVEVQAVAAGGSVGLNGLEVEAISAAALAPATETRRPATETQVEGRVDPGPEPLTGPWPSDPPRPTPRLLARGRLRPSRLR